MLSWSDDPCADGLQELRQLARAAAALVTVGRCVELGHGAAGREGRKDSRTRQDPRQRGQGWQSGIKRRCRGWQVGDDREADWYGTG
ncbi:MAG: hypothetical protein M3R24_22425 [Chloroflexota bacterium]|nr:hypothetical protein [Chloroflexota bacterium]